MGQRFREKIERWIEENEDASWDTLTDMAIAAANAGEVCSSETARRWILQLTAPGQRWRLLPLRDAFGLETGVRLVKR